MEPDSRDNIGPASGTPTPTAAQQLAAHHNDKHRDHDHERGDHDHDHGDNTIILMVELDQLDSS